MNDTTAIIAFIDPGSNNPLIRRGTAAALLQRSETCNPFVLQGFGGGKVCCIEKITLATLYIVDDDVLPVEVLLGTDILCQNETRLVIEDGHCKLEYVNSEKNDDRAEVNDKLRDEPDSKLSAVLNANNEEIEEDRVKVNDRKVWL